MTVDRAAARAFGAMADEYERGRPGWPADAVARLVEDFGARTVLDLAAGTGKLTAVLAALADDVVAGETRRDTVPWREALEAELRLGPPSDEEAPHEQRIDRDGILAQIASFSSIGSLPPGRRAAALAAAGARLERHGVDQVTVRYRAMITTARRIDA